MSRQLASRNLSLTEELEHLEQSITRCLQDIDANFSKAHRIVSTSILPIIEQYAKHSNGVWEGSKVCTINPKGEIAAANKDVPVLETILRGLRQCLLIRV